MEPLSSPFDYYFSFCKEKDESKITDKFNEVNDRLPTAEFVVHPKLLEKTIIELTDALAQAKEEEIHQSWIPTLRKIQKLNIITTIGYLIAVVAPAIKLQVLNPTITPVVGLVLVISIALDQLFKFTIKVYTDKVEAKAYQKWLNDANNKSKFQILAETEINERVRQTIEELNKYCNERLNESSKQSDSYNVMKQREMVIYLHCAGYITFGRKCFRLRDEFIQKHLKASSPT